MSLPPIYADILAPKTLSKRLSMPSMHSWEMPIAYRNASTKRRERQLSPPGSLASSLANINLAVKEVERDRRETFGGSSQKEKLMAAIPRSDSGSKLVRRERPKRDDPFKADIGEELTHMSPDRYVTFIVKRNNDKAALNTFFLVYRRYITPIGLLDKLQKEFISAAGNKPYRDRIADIAGIWARDYYQEDFANNAEMVARLFDLRNTLIGVRVSRQIW